MVKHSRPQMAERSVIGSALISGDAAVIVCELLKPEHFLTPSLREIFSTIRRALNKAEDVDVISVHEMLGDKLEVHEDSFLYLQGLTEDAVLSSVKQHCEIVKNTYAKAQLNSLADQLKAQLEDGSSADEAVRFLDDRIIQLQREADTDGLTGGRVTAREMFEDFSKWLDQGEAETHFPFPWEKFNDEYLGYARGELVVIFGYSSDGKSVTAFEFLEPLLERGDKIGVFSLEMSSMQLARRMLSSKTEPFWKIRNKELTDQQIHSLKERAAGMRDINMDIYNGLRDSVQIARDTLRNRYDVIVVDHLHRMPYQNRMELEQHIRNLKSLAISANCAVICLAQTSRAKASDRASQKPEPTTYQLRDTDLIETEADWAMSVWQKRDSNGTRIPKESRLRMQKARDGEADLWIPCEFKPNIMKFVPVADEPEDADGEAQQQLGYSEDEVPPTTGIVF